MSLLYDATLDPSFPRYIYGMVQFPNCRAASMIIIINFIIYINFYISPNTTLECSGGNKELESGKQVK